MIWITIGLIITGIAGLVLTRYIAGEKHLGEGMTCPIGGKCNLLVNGKYSRFLGISVEKLGTAYYSFIILFYLASLFREIPEQLLLVGLLVTGIAFAFSMYLTIVQLFVVKEWCSLCLGSAAFSFIIITLAFMAFESTFAEFAYTSRDLFKWLYLVGVIIGTLVTTMHARIFIRFLKDFKISKKEERRLEMFSHSAWVALGISFLTGIGLVLTDRWREFTDSNAFSLMVMIMVILIMYEVVMNMIISPRLVGMHFGEVPKLDDHAHSFQRKLAFASIAIGMVSWFSLLALTVFDWFNYSTGQLYLMYFVLVVLGVIVTSLVEVVIYRKSLHARQEQSLE